MKKYLKAMVEENPYVDCHEGLLVSLDDNPNFLIDTCILALVIIAHSLTIIVLTRALPIEGDGVCCSW